MTAADTVLCAIVAATFLGVAVLIIVAGGARGRVAVSAVVSAVAIMLPTVALIMATTPNGHGA